MTYARTQPLGYDLSFRGSVSPSGATARWSGGTAPAPSGGGVRLTVPTAAPATGLPECIPERYRAAAREWCAEQQFVAGLGATPMPVEYMGSPCRAAELPSCPAGQEPSLTPPPVRRPAVRTIGTARTKPAPLPAGPAPEWTSKYAPESVREARLAPATAGVRWWVWGLLGGGALLTALLLTKGKAG